MTEPVKSATAIAALIEAETTASIRAMKNDLNRSIYGEGDSRLLGYGPMQAGPRQAIISNPQGTNWATEPVYRWGSASVPISKSIMDDYKKKIADNIFRESPLMEILNNKEKAMSDSDIARKAVNKRKEERAEKAAEIVGSVFEDSDWADGDTASWSVQFHDTPDKTYHYVAVKGGTFWHITGDSARYTTDDIIFKVVELSLRGEVMSELFDV